MKQDLWCLTFPHKKRKPFLSFTQHPGACSALHQTDWLKSCHPVLGGRNSEKNTVTFSMPSSDRNRSRRDFRKEPENQGLLEFQKGSYQVQVHIWLSATISLLVWQSRPGGPCLHPVSSHSPASPISSPHPWATVDPVRWEGKGLPLQVLS